MTFERYLAPGERLVWTGRPRKGVRLWPNAVYSVLGLPFVAGAIFLIREGAGLYGREGIAFDLAALATGMILAGFGLYLTIGIWVAEATRHMRIRYALSDRAAYIAEGTGMVRTPFTNHPVDATFAEDGSGTLRFGPRDKWNRASPRHAFEDIEDAAHVAELMEARP